MNPSRIPIDVFTTLSPVAIEASARLPAVARLMKEQGIRHVPVVDERRHVVGIVSQRDLNLLINLPGSDEMLAETVLVPEPYAVQTGTPLVEVAAHMVERRLGSALVLSREGVIAGIFTWTDALRALVAVLRGEAEIDSRAAAEEPLPPAQPRA
jgi:acetoin utilization protein AcuB